MVRGFEAIDQKGNPCLFYCPVGFVPMSRFPLGWFLLVVRRGFQLGLVACVPRIAGGRWIGWHGIGEDGKLRR